MHGSSFRWYARMGPKDHATLSAARHDSNVPFERRLLHDWIGESVGMAKAAVWAGAVLQAIEARLHISELSAAHFELRDGQSAASAGPFTLANFANTTMVTSATAAPVSMAAVFPPRTTTTPPSREPSVIESW
jgi:hypothetical protein